MGQGLHTSFAKYTRVVVAVILVQSNDSVHLFSCQVEVEYCSRSVFDEKMSFNTFIQIEHELELSINSN